MEVNRNPARMVAALVVFLLHLSIANAGYPTPWPGVYYYYKDYTDTQLPPGFSNPPSITFGVSTSVTQQGKYYGWLNPNYNSTITTTCAAELMQKMGPYTGTITLEVYYVDAENYDDPTNSAYYCTVGCLLLPASALVPSVAPVRATPPVTSATPPVTSATPPVTSVTPPVTSATSPAPVSIPASPLPLPPAVSSTSPRVHAVPGSQVGLVVGCTTAGLVGALLGLLL